LHKAGISAVLGQEVVVGARFEDESVTHDVDDIGVLDGGKSVSDGDGGTA
jgi:hypothetical protein